MKICHHPIISSVITILSFAVRFTFALQGASASQKNLITAMALISIRFPNSGIKEYINVCMIPFPPSTLSFNRNKFIKEQKLYSKDIASVAPFLCRKADIPQVCIKLLNQYLTLSHWNGSSATVASLSLEEVARNQRTPLVKAVQNLTKIRIKTRKWSVIQTPWPDREKPCAYIPIFTSPVK